MRNPIFSLFIYFRKNHDSSIKKHFSKIKVNLRIRWFGLLHGSIEDVTWKIEFINFEQYLFEFLMLNEQWIGKITLVIGIKKEI